MRSSAVSSADCRLLCFFGRCTVRVRVRTDDCVVSRWRIRSVLCAASSAVDQLALGPLVTDLPQQLPRRPEPSHPSLRSRFHILSGLHFRSFISLVRLQYNTGSGTTFGRPTITIIIQCSGCQPPWTGQSSAAADAHGAQRTPAEQSVSVSQEQVANRLHTRQATPGQPRLTDYRRLQEAKFSGRERSCHRCSNAARPVAEAARSPPSTCTKG